MPKGVVDMEKAKNIGINRRLVLIIFIVIVWSIPLFMPAGTLERFALEEVRIVIVFLTVGYYLGRRDGEREAEERRREKP